MSKRIPITTPVEELPEPTFVPVERDDTDMEVGLVIFQGPGGEDNGRAIYHVHPAMRERTLVWRERLHEQAYQLVEGTWVYRCSHTSGRGTEQQDANLEAVIVDPRSAADA
jgi:hypothetical protein